MNWNQVVDPFDNIVWSLLIALIPIGTIFWALAVKKMKGHKASLYAALMAILVAVFIYGMPVKLALLSFGHGVLYGLFPICWIVVTTIYLFNIIVKSGQFEIIKHSMASITSDRRLQALLIAFAFGSFLEGTAGFGAPVAITAAMLVSLGFNAFYAAGICLIANTAPVAFGAIGIPITVASQVSGIPEMAISQMVGRTLPILSLVLPFYLTMLVCGFKKSKEVFPAILVCGVSFAFLQWFSSNFLGPELPDIIAGLGSIICLIVFLKFWKPKNIWRFANEDPETHASEGTFSKKQIARAWSPFVILAVLIIIWGLGPVKEKLDVIGTFKFDITGLHNVIVDGQGNKIPHSYKFNYLSAAGTAILITALLSIPISGMKFKEGLKLFGETLKQLKLPIITVSAILGFAYVVNDSGIVITIALVLANTGVLYPFFAPILGWLGVFVTGSDTSSNALFGKLQYETAKTIGVDPLVTVASNTSGGVVGKMISPQSIAVGTAAVGLIGKEAQLFRYTLKHSLIMLLLICLITLGQAYVVKWIVPIW
ncbi:L-lactate permease [Flagellimonas olearia]|uniref:L-lactate permease n=1 Tax=Flagellimonas olearia TaxID=552546 RepID=A0A6I1DX94_9FLAO|nr:lactate permease LctP family transporter [Allomuricauda olearia]KAB7530116.1 L-lactate permease [Allomuricauda olearia]